MECRRFAGRIDIGLFQYERAGLRLGALRGGRLWVGLWLWRLLHQRLFLRLLR